mmetsp:Transcript_80709/g.214267  ORF Transcript_80709/g.214267 Transcript_80709/m.214267 type:complete len:279 (-) Transcript_80709:96-932(-)
MAARVLLLITLVTEALATYDQSPELHAGEGSPDAEAEAASCQLLQMASGLRPQASEEANAEAKSATLPEPLCNPEMKKAQESWYEAAIKTSPDHMARFLDFWTCASEKGLPEMNRYSSLNLAMAAGFGRPPYQDSTVSTADGVYPLDAAWCKVNGFIDVPGKDAILSNASALSAMASRFCAGYGVHHKTMNMYELGLVPDGPEAVRAKFDIEAQKNVSERISPLARAVLDYLNGLFCKAGMLPCGMHFCMKDFCTLADGRVGMGCQCNVTYLAPPASP